MAILETILSELEFEGANTVRVLERVPLEKREWRPHAKSMTLGELGTHLANIPLRASRLLEEGSFDLTAARPQPVPPGDLVEAFRENLDHLRAFLKGKDDEWTRASFSFRRGEQEVRSFPNLVFIRNVLMNHSIHHRGQLTVYLRILDVPLPAIYGTSADEPSGPQS
ncbi:MAG: DinB family protein [Thermoanaerobaculia bacterium]